MTENQVLEFQTEFKAKFRELDAAKFQDYCLLSENKRLIQTVYERVFRKKLAKTCSNCYVDAVIEICSTNIKKIMSQIKCDYHMRSGALLYVKGNPNSEKVLTQHTITNELAEFHLATNPGCEKFFDTLPEDWQERVAKVREALNGGKVEEQKQVELDLSGADEDAELRILEEQQALNAEHTEEVEVIEPQQTEEQPVIEEQKAVTTEDKPKRKRGRQPKKQ